MLSFFPPADREGVGIKGENGGDGERREGEEDGRFEGGGKWKEGEGKRKEKKVMIRGR